DWQSIRVCTDCADYQAAPDAQGNMSVGAAVEDKGATRRNALTDPLQSLFGAVVAEGRSVAEATPIRALDERLTVPAPPTCIRILIRRDGADLLLGPRDGAVD